MNNETTVTSDTSISSVEISKNSKGTTYKVKCYNVDIAEAKKKAIEIYESLKAKYPEGDLK